MWLMVDSKQSQQRMNDTTNTLSLGCLDDTRPVAVAGSDNEKVNATLATSEIGK